MTTFTTWTNPSNGTLRVYIGGFGATKVWAEKCELDSFGYEYKISAKNDNRNRSELGNIINEAEARIFEAAGSRVKYFDAVVALAK